MNKKLFLISVLVSALIFLGLSTGSVEEEDIPTGYVTMYVTKVEIIDPADAWMKAEDIKSMEIVKTADDFKR